MYKKLIFLSILLISIDILFTASAATIQPVLRSSAQQNAQVRPVSFALQATPEPPIQIPTIVINPTQAPAGGGQLGMFTILLVALVIVLIAALILIALIAVLRNPSK